MNAENLNRLDNCPRCGRLYVRHRYPLCPHCIEKREQDFSLCREYLRDNPETKMKELSEATGVKVQQIIQFIVEGRLIITKANPNLFYQCERCGGPIKSGRLCANCEQQLSSEVQHIVHKHHESEYETANMRHNYRIYKAKN